MCSRKYARMRRARAHAPHASPACCPRTRPPRTHSTACVATLLHTHTPTHSGRHAPLHQLQCKLRDNAFWLNAHARQPLSTDGRLHTRSCIATTLQPFNCQETCQMPSVVLHVVDTHVYIEAYMRSNCLSTRSACHAAVRQAARREYTHVLFFQGPAGPATAVRTRARVALRRTTFPRAVHPGRKAHTDTCAMVSRPSRSLAAPSRQAGDNATPPPRTQSRPTGACILQGSETREPPARGRVSGDEPPTCVPARQSDGGLPSPAWQPLSWTVKEPTLGKGEKYFKDPWSLFSRRSHGFSHSCQCPGHQPGYSPVRSEAHFPRSHSAPARITHTMRVPHVGHHFWLPCALRHRGAPHEHQNLPALAALHNARPSRRCWFH